MCLFAIRIEYPLDTTVQRPHDPDPRQHWIANAATQHQKFDRRLLLLQVGLFFRQLGVVVGRVLQREQLPAVGQRDRLVERGGPGQ